MSTQLSLNTQSLQSDGRSNLMVVSIDDFNMYLSRDDIQAFESIHELDTGDICTGSIGWVKYLGDKIPVYCFTRDFDISAYRLENRSICVILDKVNIAFMCSDIRVMSHNVENIVPLPQCMSVSSTPVEAFCLYKYDNTIRTAMLCSSKSIQKYIGLASRK